MRIASEIARNAVQGDVFCLRGNLGTGKTHFAKGFASQFGINPNEVDSPTFVLIQEYQGTLPVYHFDCYRMDSAAEARRIGAEEYFYGEGICLIEWPEKIESLLPEHRTDVYLEHAGEQQRIIRLVIRN
jgi:tRNA threonylcarbamoyladenosine biosynthesis protein TsaE